MCIAAHINQHPSQPPLTPSYSSYSPITNLAVRLAHVFSRDSDNRQGSSVILMEALHADSVSHFIPTVKEVMLDYIDPRKGEEVRPDAFSGSLPLALIRRCEM